MDADERKEALRKKGQEFLEKAISQASTKSAKGTLGDVKVVHQRDSISPPLDPALETDSEAEWLDVIDRRSREIEEGRVRCRPVLETLREARAQLHAHRQPS
jgi:hypothetical protein